MKRISFAGLWITVCLFCGACAMQSAPPSVAPPLPKGDPHAAHESNVMDSAHFVDQSLVKDGADMLAVESTNSHRTPIGSMDVCAMLRNRTDFPLEIEARTVYFDINKAMQEGPTPWRQVHVPANGVVTYKDTSKMTAEVAHYCIELRKSAP